jgi:hypothetical protein
MFDGLDSHPDAASGRMPEHRQDDRPAMTQGIQHRSFTARLIAAFAVLALLGACAGPPSIPVPAGAPPVILERFFLGRTVGDGAFTAPIAGVNRPLRVVTNGRWDGRTLTLREDFFFADGERDVKTWRFTRVGPGRYEGTREDVIGKADVRQVGDSVQLTYTADVRGRDGSVTRLDFADTIAPIDGRSVLNKAVVSRFGVPIGEVTLTFRRR